MAGLYIHIPFCQSRCIYCDFFSTTALGLRDRYVDALCTELEHTTHVTGGSDDAGRYSTLYLGGGTPSQLSVPQLDRLFEAIHRHCHIDADAEVTMECNPDDVTPDLLRHLRRLGVNRLSLGIQTFDDELLRFLRRRHTAEQAVRTVRQAQECGFGNLSIDLMFGFPAADANLFTESLRQALSLDIQHLSAYSLMYEPGTPLTRMRDSGEVAETDDDTMLRMYGQLIDETAAAGFEHYEISNFARPGYRSRHNSSYWNDTTYTGIGAGAHSYDGRCRSFHPDDLAAYLRAPLYRVDEMLTQEQHYNEYVMTRLRTREGIHLPTLQRRFGHDAYTYCLANAQPHLRRGLLAEDGQNFLRLTRAGLFVSDDIMSDLMKIDCVR